MNNYPMYGYGHDYGNDDSNGCVVASGNRSEIRIPSVSAIGSWKKVQMAAAGAGKELRDFVQSNHYVLEYEAPDGRRVEKIIGQKVFDDGASPNVTHGDRARYWVNNYSLEMLCVGSAALISDTEYGLHVVTGLPIALYQADSNNVEHVKKALMGTHSFLLNGRQRTAHVLSVRVVMEGAGALLAYGSASADALQGVIDIGGLTTDLYVARGQRPQPAKAKGFSLGVAAAADRFNELFAEAYGRSLNLEARKELLRQYARSLPLRTVKDSTGVAVSPERLAAMIESALCEMGREIATQTAAAWSDILLDFETLLVVGGGAYYFSKYIIERLTIARRAHKPEFANVTGYATLADAMANRARVQSVQQRGA